MLTERRIRDAKAESKTRFLWDGQVKNLGVRITPKGVKAYVVFYRSAGRKHLATLARVAELSLREARDKAGRQLAAIRAGEAHLLERRRRGREAATVADGLDRFFDEYVPTRLAIGRMAPRTVQIYRSQATLYVRPALGGRRVADVGRRDVESAVGGLPSATRNRALAFVAMVETALGTLLMAGPGSPHRPATTGCPAARRAVGMAAVTRDADREQAAAVSAGLLA